MAHWGMAMTHYHQLWEPPSNEELSEGAAQIGMAAHSAEASSRERQFIAITLWDSLREAQAGVAAAWEWVRENMSDELEWTETEFVDVLLSTSFGVSPSWEDPK